MTVTIQQITANGKRTYTATVKSGKRKGEQYSATVIDAGYGWHVFQQGMEAHFGTKCYTAAR